MPEKNGIQEWEERVPAPEIPRPNGWLRFLRQSAGDGRKFRNREVRRRGAALHSANIPVNAGARLLFTTQACDKL